MLVFQEYKTHVNGTICAAVKINTLIVTPVFFLYISIWDEYVLSFCSADDGLVGG